MSLGTILLLAGALGTDAFSLSLGLGLGGFRRRWAVILVGLIVVFHVILPISGWWVGELLGRLAGRYAAYLGAAVLFYLGARMVWESYQDDPFRDGTVVNGFLGLVVLAGGVSMDALSVGFTLGTAGAALLVTALVIGAVAGLMSAGAFLLARRVQGWVGTRAQLLGGLILIGVGVRLLL
ncbi:MAG: manganese efflux pump [Candidatus Desulforudis sp.]|nr:manganese efflux pump [Desulforudis sp.]